MSLSQQALVVLSYIPADPKWEKAVSVRDLAGMVFDGDARLTLRGKINRLLAQIRRTVKLKRLHRTDGPPQQKTRWGIDRGYVYRAKMLVSQHDLPEHLDIDVHIR